MTSLKGKAALVTGGGSGLGAALSQALAREGVDVAVTDTIAELLVVPRLETSWP